ncbi:uncharacterized protein ASCRUDRAFT_72444 [Ascoidea rubescens DSM 1968]|uniref:M-phase phosphoprotein 6 n=1 Tax=Ascoidea rubescens DSM 1968 TaxID=1344418 RepID=A0A1D2VA06_9ASCO|nr:hypothetical protein ASCRUDRAFT_72444 [Ascoidea rubescens DSM 1968]ODV58506.1 hypothetical protein ASCRUDRAFT_72444 [Ascoidea rubescens DSM 1968]
MSGFSSRLMNMKFMQAAAKKEETEKIEEEIKIIRDASEWKLSNFDRIIKNKNKNKRIEQRKFQSVSYLDIFKNSGEAEQKTSSAIGRRVWGETESTTQVVQILEKKRDVEPKVPENKDVNTDSSPKKKRSKKSTKLSTKKRKFSEN